MVSKVRIDMLKALSSSSKGEVLVVADDDGNVEFAPIGDIAGIPEAPVDNKKYARKNEEWEEVGDDGGLPDAPSNNKIYGRKNGAWAETESSTGGIPEAPEDGKKYARKNADWVEVIESGGDNFDGGTVSNDILVETQNPKMILKSTRTSTGGESGFEFQDSNGDMTALLKGNINGFLTLQVAKGAHTHQFFVDGGVGFAGDVFSNGERLARISEIGGGGGGNSITTQEVVSVANFSQLVSAKKLADSNSYNGGSTIIRLSQNITMTSRLELASGNSDFITIDANGKQINANGYGFDVSGRAVRFGGDFTITGGNNAFHVKRGGHITLLHDGSATYVREAQLAANFTRQQVKRVDGTHNTIKNDSAYSVLVDGGVFEAEFLQIGVLGQVSSGGLRCAEVINGGKYFNLFGQHFEAFYNWTRAHGEGSQVLATMSDWKNQATYMRSYGWASLYGGVTDARWSDALDASEESERTGLYNPVLKTWEGSGGQGMRSTYMGLQSENDNTETILHNPKRTVVVYENTAEFNSAFGYSGSFPSSGTNNVTGTLREAIRSKMVQWHDDPSEPMAFPADLANDWAIIIKSGAGKGAFRSIGKGVFVSNGDPYTFQISGNLSESQINGEFDWGENAVGGTDFSGRLYLDYNRFGTENVKGSGGNILFRVDAGGYVGAGAIYVYELNSRLLYITSSKADVNFDTMECTKSRSNKNFMYIQKSEVDVSIKRSGGYTAIASTTDKGDAAFLFAEGSKVRADFAIEESSSLPSRGRLCEINESDVVFENVSIRGADGNGIVTEKSVVKGSITGHEARGTYGALIETSTFMGELSVTNNAPVTLEKSTFNGDIETSQSVTKTQSTHNGSVI